MLEQFHRPGTIREALRLKARLGRRAAFLAGGTWLNSRDSAGRPAHCISLDRLGLDRIESRRGGLSIGAMCTLQRLIDEPRIPMPLRLAASQIVSRNIRNQATVGGHLASRLSFSDLTPMLVALDAKVVLSRPGGSKALRLRDYVARPVAGLITSVIVRKGPGPVSRLAACRNLRGSANARSVVSAAVSLGVTRGAIRDPIIALSGVTEHTVRLAAIEEELNGQPPPALDHLQARASRAVRPVSTPGAGAAFRRYSAGVAVALAFRDALAACRSRPGTRSRKGERS